MTARLLSVDFAQVEKQVRGLASDLAATRAELEQYRRRWQAVTRPDTGELQARATLHDLITNHFNSEELMQLCFDLGVFWDKLPGDALDGKARALIEKLEREERLYKLIGECQKVRPQVMWPHP